MCKLYRVLTKISYSARKYDIIADMGSKWDKRWLVKFKFLHGFFFLGNYFTLFFQLIFPARVRLFNSHEIYLDLLWGIKLRPLHGTLTKPLNIVEVLYQGKTCRTCMYNIHFLLHVL